MSDDSSTQDRETTIGFVGLGMMGMPMAENILRHGHRLFVHDLLPEKVERLAELGAQPAAAAHEIASHAGILICMVETSEQAEAVILGQGGLIEAARPGDLVICMSTLDLAVIWRLHAALAEQGIDFIDAPVAGMLQNGGARTASLKCFVGGDAAAVERARPVIGTMASEITHFGAVGLGTVIKLLNSMVMQANRIVLAEALALGAKAGLDAAGMLDLFARTYANSGALELDRARLLSGTFDARILHITLKDVQLQTSLGRTFGMPMPMATQAQQIYQIAKSTGIEDPAAVVQVYERWTGVPVVTPKPA